MLNIFNSLLDKLTHKLVYLCKGGGYELKMSRNLSVPNLWNVPLNMKSTHSSSSRVNQKNAYVERINRTIRYEWQSQHYW
jgi:hypothetical protein